MLVLATMMLVCVLSNITFAQLVDNNMPQVVTNGSFEMKLDGWRWTTSGKAKAQGQLDNTTSHGGDYSFRISNQSPQAPNVFGALHYFAG